MAYSSQQAISPQKVPRRLFKKAMLMPLPLGDISLPILTFPNASDADKHSQLTIEQASTVAVLRVTPITLRLE
jgi:hypothetical protein